LPKNSQAILPDYCKRYCNVIANVTATLLNVTANGRNLLHKTAGSFCIYGLKSCSLRGTIVIAGGIHEAQQLVISGKTADYGTAQA